MKDGNVTLNEIAVSIPSANFTEYIATEESRSILVPAQLGDIANWITTKFAAFLSAGSATNNTMPSNSTGSSNSTNATQMFSATNYTLPEGCTLSSDNVTVSCSSGSNSGNFTFAGLNDFYNNEVSQIAGRLNTIDLACNSVDACL